MAEAEPAVGTSATEPSVQNLQTSMHVPAKQIFSWEAFEPERDFKARYALWRDTYTSRFGGCDFFPVEDRTFFANAEYLPVGTVGVVRFDFSIYGYHRTSEHVAASARDDVLISFNTFGDASLRFGHRDVEVPQGGAIICSNTDPLLMTHQYDRASCTGLNVPRTTLARLLPNLEDSYGLLNGQSPAALHLLQYAGLLLGDSAANRHPVLDMRIETMLLDLIVLTIGAPKDMVQVASERGLRAARLMAIKAEIRATMGSTNLSIGEIAKRQGVSPRYIHILFEGEGKTFTEYVHEQRLAEAHRMLTSPAYGQARIGDIAFAVGFQEPSTFNRLFRQAYGATPTDVRQAALKR